MSYPKLSLLARFYTRFELPGTTRLMDWAGVRNDALWADAPARTVRGKWDACHRSVNLSNWSERLTYFLRRYYELSPQLMLFEALRPGDTVVDIGANIGMITTLAARLVGPTGRVEAFEPNPECSRRVEEVVRANALKHVRLHTCALGDVPGELVLTVPGSHAGYGTLARVDKTGLWADASRISVHVRLGDDVLGDLPESLAVVKIDVEGFETYVLRGLRGTLSKHRPLVIAELYDEQLQLAGSSGEELFDLMSELGFSAYAVRVLKPGMFSRPGLALRAVTESRDFDERENTLAWVDPDGRMMKRIRHLAGV